MPDVFLGLPGQLVFAVLVLAAVSLLAWTVAQLLAKPRSDIQSLLAPYAHDADEEADLLSEAGLGVEIVSSAMVKRAIAGVSTLGVSKSVVPWLERKLDQANVPLRAAEVLFAYSVAAALATLLMLLTAGPILAFGLAVAFAIGPLFALRYLARRRRTKFTAQLPDALKLLSGTLRSGFSLVQGIETLSSEVGEPMDSELHRALTEARLGRRLEDALGDMADRLESADFAWTVMAIGIQREVGGNLAELLDTVAETITARDRLRREVRALTAEGKISAIVIGILPVALGGFMWLVNREYIGVLTESLIGQTLLVGSALLALFGFWWMKKTIEIEV
ncbi:MAG TPA: type II secretion system F family protein [Acidimicrobiales bacterium]|nr:type II secretion system F family protein [Acidimicrobiales bacterium]